MRESAAMIVSLIAFLDSIRSALSIKKSSESRSAAGLTEGSGQLKSPRQDTVVDLEIKKALLNKLTVPKSDTAISYVHAWTENDTEVERGDRKGRVEAAVVGGRLPPPQPFPTALSYVLKHYSRNGFPKCCNGLHLGGSTVRALQRLQLRPSTRSLSIKCWYPLLNLRSHCHNLTLDNIPLVSR